MAKITSNGENMGSKTKHGIGENEITYVIVASVRVNLFHRILMFSGSRDVLILILVLTSLQVDTSGIGLCI